MGKGGKRKRPKKNVRTKTAGATLPSATVFYVRSFLSAAALGIFLALGSSSLDAAGIKGIPLAHMYVVGMWLVGIIGMFVAAPFLSLDLRLRRKVYAGFGSAITLFCIGLAYYEQKHFTEEITLEPANLVADKINCGTDARKVGVAFGTNFDLIHTFPFDVIVMNGRPLFQIDRQDDQLIIRTLTLYDDRHDTIATINNNVIWTRNDVRKERPNKSMLAVYDHNNDLALLVIYTNRDIVQIGGIFRNNRYALIIHGMETEFARKGGPDKFEHNCLEDLPIVQTDTGMGFPPQFWIDEVPNAPIPKPPYVVDPG